jgi:hypothetical protein
MNNAIFGGKRVLEHKMCVLIFSTLLPEIFLIVRRKERDMIKMYVDVHVKYPLVLSDFNETLIFWADFRKILKYQVL